MDHITKLLKKMSKKDREVLGFLVELIKSQKGWNTLDIKKLQGSEFLRVRKGRFRIIFHIEHDKVLIDSIKLRNEKTYRDV